MCPKRDTSRCRLGAGGNRHPERERWAVSPKRPQRLCSGPVLSSSDKEALIVWCYGSEEQTNEFCLRKPCGGESQKSSLSVGVNFTTATGLAHLRYKETKQPLQGSSQQLPVPSITFSLKNGLDCPQPCLSLAWLVSHAWMSKRTQRECGFSTACPSSHTEAML